jgi:hypothetical protein
MRSLAEIAADIRRNWPKPYFGAVPYLDAMATMHSIDDDYGADSGRSIVAYGLSNMTTFKGPEARRIKVELNAMLKNKSHAAA